MSNCIGLFKLGCWQRISAYSVLAAWLNFLNAKLPLRSSAAWLNFLNAKLPLRSSAHLNAGVILVVTV